MVNDETVKAKKPSKKKVYKIAEVFQTLGQEGAKDRKTLATNIISFLAEKGQTQNVRGKDIREDRVVQQVSAMIRDINNERGKDKGSWWSTFTVEEDDKSVKLVLKGN